MGSLAGEVLFAEVLVTPTGVSKGCGYVSLTPTMVFIVSKLSRRIVEFASQEDAQRAIRELSEVPLLGRPVFIREVRILRLHPSAHLDVSMAIGSRDRSEIWCYSSSW